MAEDMFHLVSNLNTDISVPANGKTSKVIYQDEHLKAVLFGFAPGAGLVEHTAPMPGILYFVRGEAELSLGNQQKEASGGLWVHMNPNLPHSILATTETVMLLLMLKCGKPSAKESTPVESDETSD